MIFFKKTTKIFIVKIKKNFPYTGVLKPLKFFLKLLLFGKLLKFLFFIKERKKLNVLEFDI